jgi:tRNA(Met) cytidine acetyltransferase
MNPEEGELRPQLLDRFGLVVNIEAPRDPEVRAEIVRRVEEYEAFDIYVQAHYRNEPDDLGMLLDAPHHTARALALPNGKVVVSVELVFEGALDDLSIDQALRGLRQAEGLAHSAHCHPPGATRHGPRHAYA